MHEQDIEDARRMAIKDAQNEANEAESKRLSMSLINMGTLRFFSDVDRLMECVDVKTIIDINSNYDHIKNKIEKLDDFGWLDDAQIARASVLSAESKKNIEVARVASILALINKDVSCDFNLRAVLDAVSKKCMSVDLAENMISENIKIIRSES